MCSHLWGPQRSWVPSLTKQLRPFDVPLLVKNQHLKYSRIIFTRTNEQVVMKFSKNTKNIQKVEFLWNILILYYRVTYKQTLWFLLQNMQKHYFVKFFEKKFPNNIRPTCIKITKNTKNTNFLIILRCFSEWINGPHEYFIFSKNIKKWKHTVHYVHFEYIFHKSYVFDAVFEGKIGFLKKVEKVKSACQ